MFVISLEDVILAVVSFFYKCSQSCSFYSNNGKQRDGRVSNLGNVNTAYIFRYLLFHQLESKINTKTNL